MKRNKGFTLIELVIVIIVLGILSATAVPKFINLQDDAKTSVLKGVKGTINDALNISYSKLAINGLEEHAKLDPDLISTWCKGCNFVYGYPGHFTAVTWGNITDGIGDGVYNTNNDDIVISYKIGGDGYVKTVFSLADNFDPLTNELKSNNCYLEYTYLGIKGEPPEIKLYKCE